MLFQCLVSRSGICQAHQTETAWIVGKCFCTYQLKIQVPLFSVTESVPCFRVSILASCTPEYPKGKTEVMYLMKCTDQFLRIIQVQLFHLDHSKHINKDSFICTIYQHHSHMGQQQNISFQDVFNACLEKYTSTLVHVLYTLVQSFSDLVLSYPLIFHL